MGVKLMGVISPRSKAPWYWVLRHYRFGWKRVKLIGTAETVNVSVYYEAAAEPFFAEFVFAPMCVCVLSQIPLLLLMLMLLHTHTHNSPNPQF